MLVGNEQDMHRANLQDFGHYVRGRKYLRTNSQENAFTIRRSHVSCQEVNLSQGPRPECLKCQCRSGSSSNNAAVCGLLPGLWAEGLWVISSKWEPPVVKTSVSLNLLEQKKTQDVFDVEYIVLMAGWHCFRGISSWLMSISSKRPFYASYWRKVRSWNGISIQKVSLIN